MKTIVRYHLLLVLLATLSPSWGRDWFVRAGSQGDGSRDRPFGDPYQALEKAEAGDSIHVAGGAYAGKLETGNWTGSLPNLTLLGGYNDSFVERNPWKYVTKLAFNQNSIQRRKSSTILEGNNDHSNFILDGFVIDGQAVNEYAKAPDASLVRAPRETLVSFRSPGVQVRNTVILNSSSVGLLLAGEGSRLENSVIMNVAWGSLVELRGPAPNRGMVIRGNTFLFSWGTAVGGGSDGIALRVGTDVKAEVRDNFFGYCDNHGVFLAGRPDSVSLTNNVFAMNSTSNLTFFLNGRSITLDNAGLADITDVGLKEAGGNTASTTSLIGVDLQWIEEYINHATAKPAKIPPQEWEKIRASLGGPGSKTVGFAMAYDSTKAAAILPDNIKQGAHPRSLAVSFAPVTAGVVQRYETSSWEKFTTTPSLNDKRLEFVAALGPIQSFYPFPGIAEQQYEGVQLWDVQERAARPPIAYVKRGTAAQRLVDDAPKFNNNGRARDLFLVRGLIKQFNNVSAAYNRTLLIESIEPYVPAETSVARPPGRHFYVRAGAPGDGSLGNPFRDPFQALEIANAGDIIHVATGEYFGKLRSGTWAIGKPYLTLLGGYDAQFTTRNPWQNPTRLGFNGSDSTTHPGTYVLGNGDHTGFILDGFVLDGKDTNPYLGNRLQPSRSSLAPLVLLTSPGCEVRNNVFVNGAAAGVEMRGEGGTLENNIFMNFNLNALAITAGNARALYRIRRNTFLATWNDRPGAGNSPSGTAIYIRGDLPLEIDSNIIVASDNFGIVNTASAPRVKVTNNAFAGNGAANYVNGSDIVIDDKTMDHFQGVGFQAGSGNRGFEDDIDVEDTWWKMYLDHRQPPAKTSAAPSKESPSAAAPAPYAPPYDWHRALAVFPLNKDYPAGARAIAGLK